MKIDELILGLIPVGLGLGFMTYIMFIWGSGGHH